MNTRNNYVQQQPHEPDENNKIPIPFRFLGGSGAFASQLCDVRRCFVCLELSVTDRRSYIPASLTTGMAKANERNAFCRSAPSTLRSFIQCIHFLSPLSPHPVIIQSTTSTSTYLFLTTRLPWATLFDRPTGLLFAMLQMSSRPFFFTKLSSIYTGYVQFRLESFPFPLFLCEWNKSGRGGTTITNIPISTFGRLSIYSAIRHRLQLNRISSRAAGDCRFPISTKADVMTMSNPSCHFLIMSLPPLHCRHLLIP